MCLPVSSFPFFFFLFFVCVIHDEKKNFIVGGVREMMGEGGWQKQ